MLNRYVRPGDSIKRAMTARQWNEFIATNDAAKFNASDGQAVVQQGAEKPLHTAIIENALTQADRGDIRSIIQPVITPTESDYDFEYRMQFVGNTPEQGAFAVLTRAIEPGELGMGAVGGCISCKLFVPTNGDWIDRADVDTGDNTRLLATPNGSAQILWKDTGTNTTVDAIVRLGNPQYVQLAGKVINADVPAPGSGTVEVWLNTTTQTGYSITGVLLDWMHNNEKISQGKEVVIGWFPTEQVWRFIGAQCEDPIPPAIGQMSAADSLQTQALTTTSAPWNSFDASESIATQNVTTNEAGAYIQVPDVTNPSGDVYSVAINGTITPGSNNVAYALDLTLNGSPTGPPLVIDGRQAGTSLTFGTNQFAAVPTGSAPQIGVRIGMVAGTDTITWNAASFSVEKNLDFT